MEAVRLEPESKSINRNLAWVLATSPFDEIRNGKEALFFAEHARQLGEQNDPDCLKTLAVVLAENGRYTEALRYLSYISQRSKDITEIIDLLKTIGLYEIEKILLVEKHHLWKKTLL